MMGESKTHSDEGSIEQTMKEELLISELQLLYAEKRTSLSMLRTGIAVFGLPLSVFTVLVATSRYYDILNPSALSFAIPLIIITIILTMFGALLVTRALRRIRRCDEKISAMRKEDSVINDLTEE
jgi:uncharacterized membrane protein YidH (DUF202 family)